MGARILYVEDDESTHFGVREYFAEMGYVVDCAHDRDEALRRLSSASYPVVIADLRLSDDGNREPEGLAIVEHVRREHPRTRLIVLTACGDELELEARRRGADCFLQKPQPLARVAAMVERLCKEKP